MKMKLPLLLTLLLFSSNNSYSESQDYLFFGSIKYPDDIHQSINISNNKLLYQSGYGYLYPTEWHEVSISDEKVTKLISDLESIGALSWDELYERKGVRDGLLWVLEINHSGEHLRVEGINSYPENYNEYVKIIRNLLGELKLNNDKEVFY